MGKSIHFTAEEVKEVVRSYSNYYEVSATEAKQLIGKALGMKSVGSWMNYGTPQKQVRDWKLKRFANIAYRVGIRKYDYDKNYKVKL